MRRGLAGLGLLVLLGGCTRLGDQAVRHDGPEATSRSAALHHIVNDPPPDVTPDLVKEYRFAHGDRLSIIVRDKPEWRREALPIDNDGSISYVGMASIPVVGRTVAEVRDDLAKRLRTWIREPEVMVRPDLMDGHGVYVFGQVRRPGTVPYNRPLRVLDAIAATGGVEVAYSHGQAQLGVDLARCALVREGQVVPLNFASLIEKGDLRWNITLHPGDLLLMTSLVNAQIYVLGSVPQPGTQRFSPSLNLVGALAIAGGVTEKAQRSKIVVLRGNINEPDLYVFSLNEVLAGEVNDFRIEPGDIVYVPERPDQYLRELALTAAQAFVGAMGSAAGADTSNRNPFRK